MSRDESGKLCDTGEPPRARPFSLGGAVCSLLTTPSKIKITISILIITDTYRYDNLFDRASTMPVRTPALDRFAAERAAT